MFLSSEPDYQVHASKCAWGYPQIDALESKSTGQRKHMFNFFQVIKLVCHSLHPPQIETKIKNIW